jgi:hypothetical protein
MKEKFGAKLKSLGITGLREVPHSDERAEFPVPVSASEVASLEKSLGIRLPEDYRQFLLEIGGILLPNAYVRPLEGDYLVPDVLYGGKADTPYDLWSALTDDQQFPVGDDRSMFLG